MIEFLRKSEEEFLLLIDREVIEKTKVSVSIDRDSKEPFYVIHSENLGFYEKIENYSLSSFPPLFLINFLTDFHWVSDQVFVTCWLMSEENSIENKNRFFEISLDFEASLENWTKNFAFSQYFNELKKIIDQLENLEILMNDDSGLEYGFLIKQTEKVRGSQIISSILVEFFEKVKNLNLEVKRKLALLNSDELTLFSFNFPEALKIPCEQYLLYFAQFLQDLGINATSNLKEEAGKVLFSVTPTDDVEALDKIREALAVYLNLPSSPIVYDDSYAAMRLQQQIENLEHSQKMAVREIQLAEKVIMIQSETIHEKNTIISQKDSTIEQQSKIIEKISSKSIMMDSVENKQELEELYDGVKVGESETLKKWLGISLNPAKLIKTAVKNTFGKDDKKKSVLGLNDETNQENN